MRGEVLDFDEASGSGLISGDDGQRYAFDRADLARPMTPARGARVDFVVSGERAAQIHMVEIAASPWAQNAATPTAQAAPAASSTVIDWVPLLFSFQGRIRRTHFWIAWAILFAGGFVLGLIPILNVLGLLLIWPNLAIAVKRLHDMGRSGWLIAVPYLLQIVAVGYLVSVIGLEAFRDPERFENMAPEEALATLGPAFGLVAISGLISLGFWLWLGIGDSQRGPNKYGPNPKGET